MIPAKRDTQFEIKTKVRKRVIAVSVDRVISEIPRKSMKTSNESAILGSKSIKFKNSSPNIAKSQKTNSKPIKLRFVFSVNKIKIQNKTFAMPKHLDNLTKRTSNVD